MSASAALALLGVVVAEAADNAAFLVGVAGAEIGALLACNVEGLGKETMADKREPLELELQRQVWPETAAEA